MMAAAPKRLGSVLPALLEKLGLSGGIRNHQLLDRWGEIVGPKIAEVSTADRLIDGKLWISVSHPAWRNELVFMKQELIDKVNEAFGEDIVKDIIFR
jgi:predicted nucleic acid-binding Zn ribbon protein